jgi:hypothetical protein
MMKVEEKQVNLCGYQIRELRQARHLSLAALQEGLQSEYNLILTCADLVQIEHGVRQVFDVEVAVFARFFRVSPAYLIWGDMAPDQRQMAETLRNAVQRDQQ